LLVEKLWEHGTKFSGGWNFGPNDGDIKPVSWIVKKFSEQWDSKIKFEIDSGDNFHEEDVLKLDCTKAKTKLGWFPKTDLDHALKMTIDWYQEYERKSDLRKFTEQQIENFNDLAKTS